jgi:hypothetical protein
VKDGPNFCGLLRISELNELQIFFDVLFLSSQIAITKKIFLHRKNMSTSTAASVAVFEYDREAIRVKARLISMTKDDRNSSKYTASPDLQDISTSSLGQAHDMFSRIFRIRVYEFFLPNIM